MSSNSSSFSTPVQSYAAVAFQNFSFPAIRVKFMTGQIEILAKSKREIIRVIIWQIPRYLRYYCPRILFLSNLLIQTIPIKSRNILNIKQASNSFLKLYISLGQTHIFLIIYFHKNTRIFIVL